MPVKTVYLREPMDLRPFKGQNNGIPTSTLQASDGLKFEDREDCLIMSQEPDVGIHRRIPLSSVKWVDFEDYTPVKVPDEPRPSPETSSGSKKKTGKQK